MSFFTNWLTTFGVIFGVLDPFGYIPIFLAMTQGDTPAKRKWMLKRACLGAFAILTFFTFLGNSILHFFGISIPALQISGGLILLVIGFDMMQVLSFKAKLSDDEEKESSRKDDISIVPLAMPMLSGPASIASVIVLSARAEFPLGYAPIITSIIVTLIITYIALRSAGLIFSKMGLTGLHVVTRVMGLLLCSVAVQFVIDGIRAVLKG